MTEQLMNGGGRWPSSASAGRPATDGLRQGAAAMVPMIIGYAPYAIVVGSVIGAHHAVVAGWAGIWLIFGGNAHLATLHALDEGSAVLAVVTGVLVNARLLVYSASLAARWRDQPHWFRMVAAPLIIDPTWLAVEQRTGPPRSLQDERRFFLGAGLTLIAAWCTLVSAGMILGSRAGGSIGLDVAVPLCLLTVVAPRLLDRRSAPVVITAGMVAAVTTAWAAGFGLLVAIVAGAAAGRLSRKDQS